MCCCLLIIVTFIATTKLLMREVEACDTTSVSGCDCCSMQSGEKGCACRALAWASISVVTGTWCRCHRHCR